jgi:hypothetical protein
MSGHDNEIDALLFRDLHDGCMRRAHLHELADFHARGVGQLFL